MHERNKLLKDVRPLYKGFLNYLHKRRRTLAYIQTLCQLEDYLTKESAGFIMERSRGSVMPRLNFGDKIDGRRIDLALTSGDHSDVADKRSFKEKLTIRGFVELKYFSYGNRFSISRDTVRSTLKDLYRQLGKFEHEKFGRYSVKLRSPKNEIYGMVFASFVHPQKGKLYTDAEEVRSIERKAKEESFLSFNNKRPNLKRVYENVNVRMLEAEYKVSLYAGLWRKIK